MTYTNFSLEFLIEPHIADTDSFAETKISIKNRVRFVHKNCRKLVRQRTFLLL